MIPSALALQLRLFASVHRAGPRPIHLQPRVLVESTTAKRDCRCLKSEAESEQNGLSSLC